jgi:hypothetical protein
MCVFLDSLDLGKFASRYVIHIKGGSTLTVKDNYSPRFLWCGPGWHPLVSTRMALKLFPPQQILISSQTGDSMLALKAPEVRPSQSHKCNDPRTLSQGYISHTTYDGRHNQDSLNPCTHANFMVLAHEDNTDVVWMNHWYIPCLPPVSNIQPSIENFQFPINQFLMGPLVLL